MQRQLWTSFKSERENLTSSVGSLNNVHQSATTPQWIIKCADFFSSDINKWAENAAPCIEVKFGSSRQTSYDASGELSGNGQIVAAKTCVMMKTGSWGPSIQNALLTGKNIKEITLIRFSSIEGTDTPIQEVKYSTCKISDYEQLNDMLVFTFAYLENTDTITVFGQDGAKLGQTSVTFNSSTVVAKSST